jgi:hypothetical protein
MTGGGGTGATATIDISGGRVVDIAFINGGSYYATTRNKTISGG